MSAVRAISRTRPVVLAIDDVQWLDVASASALEFALRRLADEPVGIMFAVRTNGERHSMPLIQALPTDRLDQLIPGPLDLEDLAWHSRMVCA